MSFNLYFPRRVLYRVKHRKNFCMERVLGEILFYVGRVCLCEKGTLCQLTHTTMLSQTTRREFSRGKLMQSTHLMM